MPKTTPTKLDPIRKAAILISTLDHRVADELLDRMSDEQAALVRSVAMELDDVSEEEQKLVMEEFLGSGGPADDADDSGIELDEELARKIAASESFAERPRTSSEPEEPLFRFLCDAETNAIVKHLQDENPQIIAVVIAHLPPRQAADLLKHFEPQMQASLLRRIAELDVTDRDVVREVEKHLKMLLHDDLRAAQNRAIGLSTVASILTAAGETRSHLVSSLTRHDRQLAHQLRNPSRHTIFTDTPHEGQRQHAGFEKQHKESMLAAQHDDLGELHGPSRTSPLSSPAQRPPALTDATDTVTVSFDELSRLSDADLALVFRESDSRLALLALAGATPEFVGRLLKQLPTREAKSLRRRMEQLGPLRLSDIADAQTTIAGIADRLIAASAIDSPPLKQFSGAA
jgi:flagellar motor switch protein FliG